MTVETAPSALARTSPRISATTFGAIATSVFALISSESPVARQLAEVRGTDPESVCAAARAAGLGCSAVAVGEVR